MVFEPSIERAMKLARVVARLTVFCLRSCQIQVSHAIVRRVVHAFKHEFMHWVEPALLHGQRPEEPEDADVEIGTADDEYSL